MSRIEINIAERKFSDGQRKQNLAEITANRKAYINFAVYNGRSTLFDI
jgi:hypothetical protein